MSKPRSSCQRVLEPSLLLCLALLGTLHACSEPASAQVSTSQPPLNAKALTVSQPALASVERLAHHLADVAPQRAAVVQALGGALRPQDEETTVPLGPAPFRQATISEFNRVIDITIDLQPGHWLLSQVVEAPEAWKLAPPLPDSGAIYATRSWPGPRNHLSCSLRLEGGGPQAQRRVTGQLLCQLFAP